MGETSTKVLNGKVYTGALHSFGNILLTTVVTLVLYAVAVGVFVIA